MLTDGNGSPIFSSIKINHRILSHESFSSNICSTFFAWQRFISIKLTCCRHLNHFSRLWNEEKKRISSRRRFFLLLLFCVARVESYYHISHIVIFTCKDNERHPQTHTHTCRSISFLFFHFYSFFRSFVLFVLRFFYNFNYARFFLLSFVLLVDELATIWISDSFNSKPDRICTNWWDCGRANWSSWLFISSSSRMSERRWRMDEVRWPPRERIPGSLRKRQPRLTA